MKVKASRVFLVWNLTIAILALVWAVTFVLNLRQSLSLAASRLSARTLVKTMESSLSHDLLGGNFMLASDRLKALVESTGSTWSCVEVMDSKLNELMKEGDFKLCNNNKLEHFFGAVYYDKERLNKAFSIKVTFLPLAVPLDPASWIWFFGFSGIFLIVALTALFSNLISDVFSRVYLLVSSSTPIPRKAHGVLKKLTLEEEVAIETLVRSSRAQEQELAEALFAKREAEVTRVISAQVAHDIRSPLVALKSMASDLVVLPEETRVLFRSAVQRIHEIANNLSAATVVRDGECFSLLCPIVETLVLEKRLEFKVRHNIQIEFIKLADVFKICSKIQPIEFKRVLSNLINNSIDAIEIGGKVILSISSGGGFVSIVVEDSGKGIPPEFMKQLGVRGATFGKGGGRGLGLFHAKSTFDRWGGSFEVKSQLGKGTKVIMQLPVSKTPPWLAEKIVLEKKFLFVVLDDDPSILLVWSKRINELKIKIGGSIQLFSFSRIFEFLDFFDQMNEDQKVLFLIDYEFIGEKRNGLNLIESLKINSKSILVTSRADEESIQAECSRLGVRLLPKSLADLVPLVVE